MRVFEAKRQRIGLQVEQGGLVDAGEGGLCAPFDLFQLVAKVGDHKVYVDGLLPFSCIVSYNFLFLSFSFSTNL
jgi:hypothetical protein